MPLETRYALTASARCLDRVTFAALEPTSSVCPTMRIFMSGFSLKMLTTSSSTEWLSARIVALAGSN